MGGIVRVTDAALEPLTGAEVRAHLRIGFDSLLTPPSAPTATLVASAGNVNAGEHRYRVTFVNVDGESDAGEISNAVTTTAGSGQVSLSNIPLGDETVTARRVYRTAAGGTAYKRLTTIADNTATTYTDNTADASLGADVSIDELIAGYIVAAREYVEQYLARPLITQTWRYTLDTFPPDSVNYIEIPRSPLISVSSITYVDDDGNTQTLATSVYSVDADSKPGAVRLKYDQEWPDTRDQPNAVTINFTAGYGAAPANVPASTKQAMKLLIGLWHGAQLGTNKVDQMRSVMDAVHSLLDSERTRYLVLA